MAAERKRLADTLSMRRDDGRRSRLRVLERDVELELEPIATSDAIGLVGIFASLCVVFCGGVMFYGSGWSRSYDPIGWVGLALIAGGGAAFGLVMWLLEPHKAARHATHRLRFHARRLRTRTATGPDHPSQMTDAEFDALEDEVDRTRPDEPGGR